MQSKYLKQIDELYATDFHVGESRILFLFIFSYFYIQFRCRCNHKKFEGQKASKVLLIFFQLHEVFQLFHKLYYPCPLFFSVFSNSLHSVLGCFRFCLRFLILTSSHALACRRREARHLSQSRYRFIKREINFKLLSVEYCSYFSLQTFRCPISNREDFALLFNQHTICLEGLIWCVDDGHDKNILIWWLFLIVSPC